MDGDGAVHRIRNGALGFGVIITLICTLCAWCVSCSLLSVRFCAMHRAVRARSGRRVRGLQDGGAHYDHHGGGDRLLLQLRRQGLGMGIAQRRQTLRYSSNLFLYNTSLQRLIDPHISTPTPTRANLSCLVVIGDANARCRLWRGVRREFGRRRLRRRRR